MGDLIDLKNMDRFWIERRKLERKHTVNRKLTQEGIHELYQHAVNNGRSRELYFPDDYGTDEYLQDR